MVEPPGFRIDLLPVADVSMLPYWFFCLMPLRQGSSTVRLNLKGRPDREKDLVVEPTTPSRRSKPAGTAQAESSRRSDSEEHNSSEGCRSGRLLRSDTALQPFLVGVRQSLEAEAPVHNARQHESRTRAAAVF